MTRRSTAWPINRRGFLKTLGAASTAGFSLGALLARPVRAQPSLDKVKLSLAWLIQGSSAYTQAGKALGTFRKHGIDVDISRGFGSGPTAQAVGNGQFDFGLVSAPLIILNAARGLPIVALGTTQYDATMGVCVLDESPIRQPSDLVGKKLGVVATSGELAFFYDWAKVANFDSSKVDLIYLDGKVLEQTLINKQIDAMIGFGSSSLPIFVSQKIKARFMPYSAQDLVIYGNALIAHPKTLAEKPDLCRRMCDAMFESLAYNLLNPKQVLDLFIKEVPDISLTPTGPEFARVGMGIAQYIAIDDAAKQNGLGWSDTKRVDEMVGRVMARMAAPGSTKPDAEKLYTNKFVGKIKLSADDWKKVQTNTAEFAGYFASRRRGA
jgi:ABC-type nitrate/sulfonate/bicarbonate transport system substrate-binding protein